MGVVINIGVKIQSVEKRQNMIKAVSFVGGGGGVRALGQFLVALTEHAGIVLERLKMAFLILDAGVVDEVLPVLLRELHKGLAHSLVLAELLNQLLIEVFIFSNRLFGDLQDCLVQFIPLALEPVHVQVDQVFNQVASVTLAGVLGVAVVVPPLEDGQAVLGLAHMLQGRHDSELISNPQSHSFHRDVRDLQEIVSILVAGVILNSKFPAGALIQNLLLGVHVLNEARIQLEHFFTHDMGLGVQNRGVDLSILCSIHSKQLILRSAHFHLQTLHPPPTLNHPNRPFHPLCRQYCTKNCSRRNSSPYNPLYNPHYFYQFYFRQLFRHLRFSSFCSFFYFLPPSIPPLPALACSYTLRLQSDIRAPQSFGFGKFLPSIKCFQQSLFKFIKEFVFIPIPTKMLPQLLPLLNQVRREPIIHVVEERLHRRELCLHALSQRILHLLAGLRPNCFLVRDICVPHVFQKLRKPRDWIIVGFPLVPLLFFAVHRRVIRRRMISHSVGHEFQEVRLFVLEDVVSGKTSCFVAGQGVVSVDSRRGNREGYRPRDNPVARVLVFSWS